MTILTRQVEGIQPSILRWARESQGYSLEDVARHLECDVGEIKTWEAGDTAPTYSQLEELAYNFYKRPLAIFFLPQPPLEPRIEQKFRTLPDFDLQELDADTRYRMREAHALQISLKELNEGINPSDKKIFRQIAIKKNANIYQTASDIRKFLGISLSTQIGWQSPDIALKEWRNAVEEAGVFVFKHSFKQKAISGFCLLDKEFPLIYLNNSAAKTRQIFSLFHELAHLLLNVNAISKFDWSYINQLPQKEKRIELFCNALAAECLIPSDDFELQIQSLDGVDERFIKMLASRYSISREAVLRRMLDRDLVSQSYYEMKAEQWVKEIKTRRTGGNYYATHAAYLGQKYMGLVFSKLYQGRLNMEQAAYYLGVKTKSMAGLEILMLRRAVSE
jgi:Zn-dependent peptidase ImmA (M78 family)